MSSDALKLWTLTDAPFRSCLLVLVLADLDHQTGEREQTDEVGDDHQAVEHVGHVPNQIDLECRAEDDEQDNNCRVNLDRLLAEQRLDIGLAEEIPANNRRKCEE